MCRLEKSWKTDLHTAAFLLLGTTKWLLYHQALDVCFDPSFRSVKFEQWGISECAVAYLAKTHRQSEDLHSTRQLKNITLIQDNVAIQFHYISRWGSLQALLQIAKIYLTNKPASQYLHYCLPHVVWSSSLFCIFFNWQGFMFMI